MKKLLSDFVSLFFGEADYSWWQIIGVLVFLGVMVFMATLLG